MKKVVIILLFAAIGSGVFWYWQKQAGSRVETLSSSEQATALVEKLKELVAIRERQLKTYQKMVEVGRAPSTGTPEIDLVESKIELARETRQKEVVLTEMHNLVAAYEGRLKALLAAQEVGVVSSSDVDAAKAALVEAEIRLLRERILR